ncbi:MAG: helix-turn-helix transcriptional regulator [Beutenbergiaceae bacterium]
MLVEKVADTVGVAVLSSPVRRRIVDHLANLPALTPVDGGPSRSEGCSAAELADLLDLHVTTVRFHLDQLVTVGLLHTSNRRGDGAGRPRKMYALTPGRMDAPAGDSYLALAEILADSFGGETGSPRTPEEAGVQWAHEHVDTDPAATPATTPGRWLGKIGRLVDSLEEWGYTPNVATREGGRSVEVTLVDCPFLALASTHPEVVCGIHRGLIRGTLEQIGEQSAEISLEPLVGPATCIAHIRSRSQFSTEPTSRRTE